MALVITKQELERIKKWTNENKEDPDAARRRAYVQSLNDASAKMTKNWPNSVENVNKRNEEVRRARAETSENANMKFYKMYVKRKKAEQERLMYSARDTIFKNTDAPKMLLSGVIESVIQKEREEQLKFNRDVYRKYEREQERLYNKSIFENAQRWHALQAERKKRRFEVDKQNQMELVEQARENAERQRKEHEEELRMQQQDIINSKKEIEMLKEFDKKFKAAEKVRIWRDNMASIAQTEARRKEARVRARMDDRLIDVLKRSQATVERRRRETEREERKAKLRVLEEISKKLWTGTTDRDGKEQASLDKAHAEHEAAAVARQAAAEEKAARQAREVREEHQRCLREQAQRQHEDLTMHHFHIMNRFRNEEIYEEYKNEQRKERERKKKEYKEENLRLMKERQDRDAQESAETKLFYGEMTHKKFRRADNMLFSYAEALLEEAKANGRPTLPILKSLDRYCKMYRLYPMPELPASLQAHFPQYRPTDASQADPDFCAPKPPPGLDQIDTSDADGPPDGRRDGLQALVKLPPKPGQQRKPAARAGATATAGATAEAGAEQVDYKRQAPANGLQRKPEPKEKESLPPIKVLPCKMHECICNLKGVME